MREILYKKKHSYKNRRKLISISEHSEDNECQSTVRKSFIYIVTRVDRVENTVPSPQVFIKKYSNTKLKQEKFSFRVRGTFFMAKDRYIFKVEFCHALKIHIIWKGKVFSPTKSVTLT